MRRLPVIPTIVVALAAAAMVALGVWQLQRRQEKLAELAVLAANPSKPAMAFPNPPVGGDELLFRRASAFCLKPVRFRVEGAGKAGFRVIAECATGAEGPGFAVQLGTTPDPQFKSTWTGGKVSGTIAQAPSSLPLIVSALRGRALRRLMLVADTPAPGLAANVPPSMDSIPNNHLAYAVQWFVFAGLAVTIYLLALRRRRQGEMTMRYVSTRGAAPVLDFREVTLAGLAKDGGLYLPERWPSLTREEIAAMAGLSYVETAVRVMTPFVGDSLSEDELRALCAQAYGRFAHDAVTPLAQLDHGQWLLELFHGPTLAFKDVALQLLGLLFERFLTGDEQSLTVVGATSGDTGSAAIDALAGRERVEIFMLHPKGRVSDVQRRQMTTVLAPNVHNIAIEGDFDDAQRIVKAMFNANAGGTGPLGHLRLSAVNSINWARLMAQVVYYFYAAVRLGGPERSVAFSVPTGNFGDVFAGYVAARMGLPIAKLIVATNVNDILHRALSSGDYSAKGVVATPTPSMDIQVSSNFERLLFDLGGRDGAAMREQMAGFERSGAMRLTNAQREGASELFASARIDLDDMALAMRWACERAGQVIDPHSAIGLAAARASGLDAPVVTLATAHPAKFRDAVERATGMRPALPGRVGDLFERAERYETLPATLEAVAGYVAATAQR